jgi:tetratricopeptide (TPR) repeat protein
MFRAPALTLCITLLCPLLLSSCATYRSGLDTAASGAVATDDFDAAQAVWTAERGSKEGLQKATEMLEALVTADPEHQDALILLSRCYYFMADGYTDEAENKQPLFETGVYFGERAMAADASFKALIEQGKKKSEAVSSLQKDDIMAIYWTASNLGKWAKSKGFSTLVKYKGYVAAMMSHALELDETAFYGGPPRFWGAFYAAAPSFAGGDMGKSREMFEKTKAMNPEYLGTYVLYADYYAKKAQEKDLFRSLLQHVLDTPADVLPEMLPEQNVEKQKAQRLMDSIDDLFAE